MKSKHALYFVALIPPDPWKGDITMLKEEFSAYNSVHALKSPPHITLIPPFRMEADQQAVFIEKLDHFSGSQQCFNLKVTDFGAFKPRVIYLKIEISALLKNLHGAMTEGFDAVVDDTRKQLSRFNPHMTIAFRDLTKPMFYKAWEVYRHKKFSFSFEVDAIYLLKHNGEHWDIVHRSGF